jgi:hypothetical protein
LIGFEKQVEQRPSRSFLSDFGGVMPSPKERERSRASLQREAPVSDEATLLVLQEQAADYIRESKRRDASEPDELASKMLHVLARDHFRHVQKKRLRRKGAF